MTHVARVGFAAELTIGYNFSGMYAQLTNLREALDGSRFEAELYDMWNTRSREYDLIHIFGVNQSLYPLTLTLQDLNVPYIVSPNFLPVSHRRMNRLFTYLNVHRGVIASRSAMQRHILANAHQIIVNSTAEVEALTRTYRLPRKPFRVIPNGVEREYAHGDPSAFRAAFDIRDEFVLTVSEVFNETKNHLGLLRAWSPDMPRLVFVGNVLSGEYAKKCRRELSRLNNVTLVGPLTHGDPLLRSAYKACSAFVLPSLVETTGLSALEAGVSGAPIAITKVGATWDYFGRDAFYCDPHSKRSIRATIRSALAAGRCDDRARRLLSHFDWSSVANMVRDCYSDVLHAAARDPDESSVRNSDAHLAPST